MQIKKGRELGKEKKRIRLGIRVRDLKVRIGNVGRERIISFNTECFSTYVK